MRAIHKSGAIANYVTTPTSGSAGDAWELFLRRQDNDFAIGRAPNLVQVDSTYMSANSIAVGDIKNLDNITQGNDSIMGSTQDYFICVGRWDDSATGDQLGDGIFMRVSNL